MKLSGIRVLKEALRRPPQNKEFHWVCCAMRRCLGGDVASLSRVLPELSPSYWLLPLLLVPHFRGPNYRNPSTGPEISTLPRLLTLFVY